MKTSNMKRLIEDLYLTDLAPVSPALDEAVERFRKDLPFNVVSVPSGTSKNGWVVPESWRFTRAEIRKDGELIYDGRKHPLGVAGYSPPFSGSVELEELKKHLFYSEEFPEDLIFHCTHFFRPLEREWGFCVPKTLYDSLKPGAYQVRIEAEQRPGAMKILEYSLPGETADTVLLHAHDCHPGQANDDLSGCAVGIEFLKRLAALKKRKYTYTLLISPELFGSFHWLDRLGEAEARKLKYGIMLKSVGNDAPLKLQLSCGGGTEIDLSARNALRFLEPGLIEGPFRRVYGNDETIFEAPGYEIPTISLTRYPFREYHTSRDTPEIISEAKLEEAVRVLEEISHALENNARMRRHFKGLLALSHPSYNLYQPYWNPAERSGPKRTRQFDWHYLMIDMFRYFEGNITVLEIAEKHGLPFREVFEYLSKLEKTGAISFVGIHGRQDA